LRVTQTGSTSTSALVGRDGILAELRAVLAATAAGTGGCLVVTGAPGIGKTRLLTAAAQQADALGLAVAAAGAAELDRVAPMRTLASALRAARPAPIDLSGLQTDPNSRFSQIDRIGEALEEYTADRPLLVIIDDAQWTDELSVLALRVLVPILSSAPVRWLLARRPVPARSPAQETIDWLIKEGAEEICLHPLDEPAVRQLCSNILGAAADATVLALAARCGGNPFLLNQLLDTLREAEQLVVSDGVATVVGDELPLSFVSAVDQRLRALSGEAQTLLQVGSVFGRPFTVHAAARLAGVPATALVGAADEAVAAGLLAEQGAELSFCHDLLREAVYAKMSEPVRAAMHREAIAVVRAEGRSAIEVAEHVMHSGRGGDAEAVEILRTAAAEAAGRAPGTAADLIDRALDMVNAGDEMHPRLAAEAVSLLAAAGRLVDARDRGEAALDGRLDPHTEATVLLGLAEALKHAGQNRSAADYASRALARPGISDALRARLHAITAHALLWDDMGAADRAGADADRLGTATGEHGASVFGLAARSVVARAQGRLDDALAYAQHAVGLADRAGGEARQRHPRVWLGAALVALDRFAEAEEVYAAGRREAGRFGTAWSQPLWSFYRANLLTWRGDLDDAVAEAEGGSHVADQLTAQQLGVPLLGLLSQLAVMRDQIELAREYLHRLERHLADGVTAAEEDIAWTNAVFLEADGQPAAALNALASLYDRLPDRMLLLTMDPGRAPAMVRIALAAGDRRRAELAAAAVARLATLNPAVPSMAGAAAHAYGILHDDPAALQTAIGQFRGSPRRLARAAALDDAAELARRSGDRTSAVTLLQQALREYTTAGAGRAVARVDEHLRALDTHPSTERSTDKAPATPRVDSPGVGDLSEAEHRVARLVARGYKNREIAKELVISPHTVDSHLRHIFAKLGVNSRVKVAQILASKV
jgi:ATP/maltotriose-dependent transcriptional regulator MalT